jgi:hypothetical protein
MTLHPKGTAIARRLLDTPTGCMRSNAVVKVPLASLRAQSVFLFLIKSFVARPQKRSIHLLCFNATLVCDLVMCDLVVKEHERALYDFDPTMFNENRFWN